ncbi:hypothetical protein [Lewinella sp. W8]|uniref:hypothetical protein n=1 Tax=Lewinella sp. W8 TaxID=2528208 RepID=UPI001067554E|nr:hypothetical protein [Lewinella sp. W8]MTB51818.1 hypothetical protein [Lewinella sp. W8]
MLKHSATLTVVGFVLLFVGILTLFLNMVGVDLVFMKWLYETNPALSFIIRLVMVIAGLIMIYVGQTDWDREEA